MPCVSDVGSIVNVAGTLVTITRQIKYLNLISDGQSKQQEVTIDIIQMHTIDARHVEQNMLNCKYSSSVICFNSRKLKLKFLNMSLSQYLVKLADYK